MPNAFLFNVEIALTIFLLACHCYRDCYVAATGMPDPRPDHAVLMAKFANTCLAQIKDLTGNLESQLGPGTSDLAFRIGMHSG